MTPAASKAQAPVTHLRIPTLDGWRAVAITAVLFAHIQWPVDFLARISPWGSLGVQLFFALSGFLITSRLLEEYDQAGRISWKNFYIRRAFRILPPAFLALGALAVLGLGLHVIPMDVRQLVASAFFYRNYIVEPGWNTGHFWSLAVEEQFYLLWPAVLIVIGVARGARAAVILACAFVAWRAADQHFDWVGHFQPLLSGVEFRTDYRISQLFWGCALAFVWRVESNRKAIRKVVRSYWVFGVVAAQTLLLIFQPSWKDTGTELLMVALLLITIADPRGFVSRVLETRAFKWVGLLSYSLYLWQQLFLPMRAGQKILGSALGLILNVALTFAAAAFSYYLVERASIRIGRKLTRPRKTGENTHTEDHPIPVVQ
jgi:peptidoglycan/LPS O-acetylase OafA/YrhL